MGWGCTEGVQQAQEGEGFLREGWGGGEGGGMQHDARGQRPDQYCLQGLNQRVQLKAGVAEPVLCALNSRRQTELNSSMKIRVQSGWPWRACFD